MADDWIKMRVNLDSSPKVVAMAAHLDEHELLIVGGLLRLWGWADQHSETGNAMSVTRSFLNRYVGVNGFAEALESVGWLAGEDGELTFPDFSDHNGKTGKSRAQTAKRVARHKAKSSNAKGNATSVTDALPREDKIRTKKNTTYSKVFAPPTVADVEDFCRDENLKLDAQEFTDHYTANGWKAGRVPMKNWQATARNWHRRRLKNQGANQPHLQLHKPEGKDYGFSSC